MIEAEKDFAIEAPIHDVWEYVQDIKRWADLIPGCRECTIIDEHRSRWTIKVGAGGLVKTVNVLVEVEKWDDGPERVNFTYKLESEPVVGGGSYFANAGQSGTDIRLHLRVEGDGPMAPMWEAVCKPLFNPLATTFSEKLKSEIELYVGIEPTDSGNKHGLFAVFSSMAAWWRRVFTQLFSAKVKE